MEKYNYGMIGLGVMGRNLLYNIADNGFSIAGFDLDQQKIKELEDELDLIQRLTENKFCYTDCDFILKSRKTSPAHCITVQAAGE